MRAALAVAIALAACGRPEPRARREPVTSPVPTAPADAAIVGAASPIPAATRQLVTVIIPEWTSTTAELRRWTRDGAAWKPAGPAWQGVVGRTGASWGAGLHGRGAPAGRDGPLKREGDGSSPAGVFLLADTYGYAERPPEGTALPYTKVDASWKCVDDPRSRHYNQVLDQRTTTPDWAGAEEMRRSDELYTWVVSIAHNATRTAGDGSCIFLHVWSGPGSSTVGCVAMPATTLALLISELGPADRPALVLLPRAEYDAHAIGWGLPPYVQATTSW